MEKKKQKYNFTSGPIVKPLILFAIPLAISFTLQNLYNMADMIVVGRFLGENAIAAVGTTNSIFMLITMMITGATVGISVVVSQYFGGGEEKMVKKAVYTGLYIVVSLGIIFSIIGAIFSRQLLLLISTPENVIDDAALYLRIVCVGALATALYNFAGQLMRALGDGITAMIMLIIASVLNVGLNLLFIAVLKTGVEGVAYATVIAMAFSAVSCAVIALKKLPILRPTKETAAFDKEVALQIAKIAAPAALQQSTTSLGSLCVQSGINSFGSMVMAAFNAANKLETVFTFPPGGLTQALQVVVGQNMGAEKPERVKTGVKYTFIIQEAYHIVTGIILIVFGKNLLGLFVTGASDLMDIGYVYLVMIAIGSLANAVRSLTLATLTGSGDAGAALMVSAVELCGRIIGAFVLAKIFGYPGVFLSTPLAWTLGAIYGSIRYFSGKWKDKAVVRKKTT